MARPKHQRSARPLALLLVAAVVPLIVFAVLTTVASLNSERRAQEQEALAGARRVSSLVDAELHRQLDLVAELALAPELDTPANIPAFSELLRREQADRPLWLTAILADPDGNVLFSTRVQRRKVVDPDGLRQVAQRRLPAVGNVARGIAGVALPVRAPVIRDGQVRFVITAAVRPDGIRQRLLESEVPAGWVASVVDQAGRIVARSRGDDSMLAQPINEAADAARKHHSSGLFQGRLRDAGPAVGAFYVSPENGWTVYFLIPSGTFNGPLHRATVLAAAGGAASIALAGVFLTLLLRELRLRRREAAALEDAQRLESLGRLTGGVAHDFNNLLAVISGNLELLERRLPGAAGHRSVTAMRGAVERGVSLTRGLLTFSRNGPGQGTAEDVNACLRGVFGMVRETLGARGEAALDLQAGLPEVVLDRVQFDLAMLNLAANARDAMPGGGQLRIATRAAALADGTPAVAVTVSDTGSGIPAELLPRVFEPFFTTKEIGHGTGLGLAQVYGFTRSVGGEARIDSRLGTGTTVTLLLAAAGQHTDRPTGHAGSAAQVPAERIERVPGRILLVDDNEAVRDLTATYLREHFAQVEEASDATAALAALAAGPFAAVLSDVVMPGPMGGIGLAQEVRRRWPETPVVLMSGYTESAAEARALGVPVLGKPLELARLVEILRAEMAAGQAAGA